MDARTLYIGDVHGCADELSLMLEKFAFVRGKDSVYQTGDVINKGPDSLGALRIIQENQIRCVLGNHETGLLHYIREPEEKRSHKEQSRINALENLDWVLSVISAFPLWIDTPHALLVHAGLEPGKKNLSEMDPRILVSIRTWDGYGVHLKSKENPPWFECVSWEKPVVFGHWAERGLVNLPDFKGLDTGCVYGKALSAWCPEEDRLYQVPARKEYCPI